MFTGLIEELGHIAGLGAAPDGSIQLRVAAPIVSAGTAIGDSIAVNGCCLTVSAARGDELTFDLLGETLQRTNLGRLAEKNPLNLERALAADGRLGGHFVQGHIDATSRIISLDATGADYRLEVELPRPYAQYVVLKGSIAINGISLTVAEVAADRFTAWIIPHTKQHTNLQSARAGDLLNLEFDLLAKYVERMLNREPIRE
ncbi:MAG: riboflavin synthase [Verrucomicrobiota bacterium]|nr:riboflavin synthase [Verrucomicrobiota bacterium]